MFPIVLVFYNLVVKVQVPTTGEGKQNVLSWRKDTNMLLPSNFLPELKYKSRGNIVAEDFNTENCNDIGIEGQTRTQCTERQIHTNI